MRRVLVSQPALALIFTTTLLVPSQAGAFDVWVIDTPFCTTEVGVRHVVTEIYGTLPSTPGTGEVKVEQHVLSDGEVIPLPAFDSDGRVALDGELFWTVALEAAICDYQPPSSAIEVRFVGRTLQGEWSSCHNPGPTDLRFRVTVVAVRGPDPTAVESETFGRAKSRFR
jgi:hypothetical protein